MRRAEMDTGMSHTAGRRHAGAPAARRPRQGDRHVLPGIRPDRPRRPGRRRRPRPVGACRVAAPGRPARETAALAIVRGGVLTYVAEATADTVVAAGWQGREVAVHATSTGKVLLAYSHAAELRVLLRRPAVADCLGTPRRRSLRSPRSRRSSRSSATAGTPCAGASSRAQPGGSRHRCSNLAGHPVAVVSVWGPSERLGEERIEALGAMAIAGTAEIAGRQTSASA